MLSTWGSPYCCLSQSEYCKLSLTALPTWLLRNQGSLTPWSLPRPHPSLLFQINWRCRRLSSTRTPSDTVSRLSSITALYRSNHYQSRDIRTNTEPMSDTATRAVIAQICWPDNTHSAAKQRLQKRPSGGPSSSALTVSLLYRARHDIMDADAANTQNSWCPGPGPAQRLPGPPRRV